MRILVIGSGGREHALCWKIAQSTSCSKLYCAPGNGGIGSVAEIVNIKADDIDALCDFAIEKKVDITVVGPETPLVAGIVDKFREKKLKVFGPAKINAAIEGSKVFAKELMQKLGVPTAEFKVFDKFEDAEKYVASKKGPFVVKADGLCAGKGVVICKGLEETRLALKKMMVDKVFGAAADRVIIEDCLVGEEASIIVVSDGENVVPLASSQDHKRIFNGDKGPNTGGMGAYSPAPVITDALFKKIMDTVIYPVIKGLAGAGTPYKGALYAGIMVTDKGPFVLEFNARFGDPETQVLLPRLKTDLLDILERSIDGNLGGFKLTWDARPCVSVVMASGGYPGDYEKGFEIKGLDEAGKLKEAVVFHAGTKLGRRSTDGRNLVVTSGGRVLDVTALGNDMKGAMDNCYAAVKLISFERAHYRNDIGYRALKQKEARSIA